MLLLLCSPVHPSIVPFFVPFFFFPWRDLNPAEKLLQSYCILHLFFLQNLHNLFHGPAVSTLRYILRMLRAVFSVPCSAIDIGIIYINKKRVKWRNMPRKYILRLYYFGDSPWNPDLIIHNNRNPLKMGHTRRANKTRTRQRRIIVSLPFQINGQI